MNTRGNRRVRHQADNANQLATKEQVRKGAVPPLGSIAGALPPS